MDEQPKIRELETYLSIRKARIYAGFAATFAFSIFILFCSWPPTYNTPTEPFVHYTPERFPDVKGGLPHIKHDTGYHTLWEESHEAWYNKNFTVVPLIFIKEIAGIWVLALVIRGIVREYRSGPRLAAELYDRHRRDEASKKRDEEHSIIYDEERRMAEERRELRGQLKAAREEGIRQAERVKWAQERERLRKKLATAVEDSKRQHLNPPPEPAYVPAPPSPPSPPVSRHLSARQIDELALKAVHRIADLDPRERAGAWEKWRANITREYPELIAQEVKQRAADLAGPVG